MSVDLYHHPASGPCRSVRLIASLIGVELNLKYVDLLAEEQFKLEFTKMNPQHAVPVINDNGFILSESRAICTYLIEKYGKDDSLYPKDPQRRALVNHRLYFDIATLSQSYLDYYIDKYFNKKTVDQEKMAKIHDAFGYLEKFLQDSDYVAGNNMTVADIVLLTAVSNFTVYAFDYSYYKNVVRWFATIKSKIPSYEEINEDGLEVYRKLVKKLTEE